MDTKSTEDRALDLIERGVEAVASKVTALAEAHGDAAWDLILGITRLEGLSELMPGFVALLFLAVALPIFVRTTKVESARNWNDFDGNSLAFMVSMGVSAISSLIALVEIPNTWAWVAIFNPELALAKKALDVVVGG